MLKQDIQALDTAHALRATYFAGTTGTVNDRLTTSLSPLTPTWLRHCYRDDMMLNSDVVTASHSKYQTHSWTENGLTGHRRKPEFGVCHLED